MNRYLGYWYLAGLLLFASGLQAQHWLGYANSSYAGTNGLYINPANIANGKYNFYLNLAGVSVNFHNDYLKLNTPYSPWRVAFNNVPDRYLDSNGVPEWNNSYMAENLNGKNKNISFMAEVRGPSFLFSIGPKHTFAIATRTRMGMQLLDLNEDLARIMRWGTDPLEPAFSGPGSLEYGKLYGQNDFTLNVNAFAEHSLTYSGLVHEDGPNAFKAGLTVKRLTGLYSAYFQNKPGGGVIVHRDDSIGLVNTSIQYAYVNENYYTASDANLSFSKIFMKDKLGSGWGFDIGFAYEYRPDYENFRYKIDGKKKYDRSAVKHKFRIAAAITDLGNINYNNSKWVGERVLPANVTLHMGSMDTLKKMFEDFGQENGDINGYDRMNENIAKLTGGFQSANNSFKTKLPATLNLQFDYNIVRNIFVNATYIQSLRKKGGVGMRHFTQLSVTPRIESKWFEAAVPILANNDFRSVNFGLFFRVGPLFFGSDRVGSLIFNTRNMYGMDVYAGISLSPLFSYKRKKDRDRDGVSDKLDACVDSAGSPRLKGCPDFDEDGVADKDDQCPDVAGIKSTRGCPDSDGDKIADDIDHCPTLPGSKELNGCPDVDQDGVIDTADFCKDQKGNLMMEGCPDSDGDGLPDHKDKCPNEKGPKKFEGCPQEEKPQAKDTIKPRAEQPVVAEKPVTQAEEEQVLKEVFESLQFESGSAIIKDESIASLGNLVRLLAAKPTYLVSIEGHTDNVGDPSANLRLSKRRAQAVKEYLVSKGIEAKRVLTEGYGDTRPLVSNSTPEGRRKNRRVEFMIMRLAE